MDLIDRQAAIDAHCELCGDRDKCNCDICPDVEVLQLLPSAQPVDKDINVPANDLISRQAAIEAIVNTISEIGYHDNSEVARYGATFRQHEIIDIIENLPSAQPRIIRCRDCKHWTDENGGLCDIWDHYVSNEEFFCGCGERREADGSD